MDAHTGKNLNKQNGLTLISIVMLLAFMALILMIVINIVPVYLNNMAINNAIESTLENNDTETMLVSRFRSEAMKTIIVNGIRDFDTGSIQYTQENAKEFVEVKYEKRVHLFYNIDAVLSFENRFDR